MFDHHEALCGPFFQYGMILELDQFWPRVLFKGGGAQVPKQNKKLENMQLQLMQAQLRQAGQKIEMPNVEVPPPPPPPPPPPSSSSVDVQDAATEAQRQALKRQGYQSTLFAGDTGGYKGSTLGGNKTLLGGS